MSNKLLRLLEKVGNFILKPWPNMADWRCIFHELIVANEKSLKPN